MVEAKTLLKWAAIGLAVYLLIQVAQLVLSVAVSAVFLAIQIAFLLLMLGAVGFGAYWLYKTFVTDSSSSTSRSREKIYER